MPFVPAYINWQPVRYYRKYTPVKEQCQLQASGWINFYPDSERGNQYPVKKKEITVAPRYLYLDLMDPAFHRREHADSEPFKRYVPNIN